MADYNSSHSGAVLDAAVVKATKLPTIAGGDSLKIVRVNAGETGYETVAGYTAAQIDAGFYTMTAADALLAAKQAVITGAATTIASSDLTASRVLISNGSGKVAVSSITETVLGYLDATSSVQDQIDAKQDSISFGSAWGSTSGTSHTWAISSSNRPIVINFAEVGIDAGTDELLLRLGDAGGIESTGYVGGTGVMYGSPEGSAGSSIDTTGFQLTYGITASSAMSGNMFLTPMTSDGKIWQLSGNLISPGDLKSFNPAGTKTLSGAITQVQITTISGSSFDYGTINIFQL